MSASVSSSIDDLGFSLADPIVSVDFWLPVDRKDERTAVDVIDRTSIALAVLEYESEAERVKTELSTLLSIVHLLEERLATLETELAATNERLSLAEGGEGASNIRTLQLRLGDLALERRRVVTQIIYTRLVSVGVSGGDVFRAISIVFER